MGLNQGLCKEPIFPTGILCQEEPSMGQGGAPVVEEFFKIFSGIH